MSSSHQSQRHKSDLADYSRLFSAFEMSMIVAKDHKSLHQNNQ